MSRFPARARVLKTGNIWTTIYPGGRKRWFSTWGLAMRAALEAVIKERTYERRLDPAWQRRLHSDECEEWNSETGGNGGSTRHDCICGASNG